MTLRQIRLGSLENVIQYDDGDFDKAISVEDPIECTAAPVAANDVLRLGDVGTSVGDVFGPAGATDSNIAEFDGVTGKLLKDGSLSHANTADAISKKHTQGTDTALGVLSTKNPPIDADKAVYRDSTTSDALVTSTWAQVKAFLKTYFDTLYNLYVHPNHSGDVTSVGDGAQTIANSAVTLAKMANMATSSILGRKAAGVGAPEVLSASDARGVLGLAITDSPVFVTAKFSGLTDGKIPYHVDDATGLADGPTKTDVDSAVSLKHTRSHAISSTSDHSDVNLAGISNNDLMQWDDPSSKWLPKSIAEVVSGQSISPGTTTITKLILATSTELTISGGAVTATQSRHTIDTEGDAASDDLDTINGGTAGQLLIISAANDARTVVCKQGAGLLLQADFDLDSLEDTLTLECKSASVWREIARASNG